MLEALLLYVLFGSMVGILAGLMGAGGAMLLVPILHFTLAKQGVDPAIIHHMAIATTMANILFTSTAATYSHHKRGVVPWRAVAWIVPGILAGAFAGSYATAYIAARPLTLAFACFLVYGAIQMFVEIKPKASRHMPGIPGKIMIGLFIGLLSGLLGIGGAAITMPILLICGVPVLSVIAAAGAFGFPVAVAGCIGFALTAWGYPTLPPYSLGFIYLPALAGLVPSSMLTAPLGVKLSHSLSPKTVRRGVGVFMLFMAFQLITKSL
ncbi:MAG: hypothetical protein DELT_02407 [Desulfovibrio sp.]